MNWCSLFDSIWGYRFLDEIFHLTGGEFNIFSCAKDDIFEPAEQNNFMDVFDNLEPNELFENILTGPIEADFFENLDFLENDLSLNLDF
jgi:hypothetical protein